MWSLLSLLTVASGTVPPFQLAAMTFAIGGGLGAATWAFRPGAARALRQPWQVWALGVGGLFGYHALFFFALRLAPPAEAQLVNYLWPLFIVLGSALLPDESLKAHHVVGALIALAGTVVLFLGRRRHHVRGRLPAGLRVRIRSRRSPGRSIRCCRAASRRCRPTRSRASASARRRSRRSSISHSRRRNGRRRPDSGSRSRRLAWRRSVRRSMRGTSASSAATSAFWVSASYLAPLLSTLFLVLAGYAAASWSLALAAALVAGGGMLAAKDMIARR